MINHFSIYPSAPRRITKVLLLSTAGLAMLSGCAHGPAEAPAAADAPAEKTVGVVSPATTDVQRTIVQPGTIQGIEEATLYAKAAGFLKAVYVDKGDRVRAGQVVALIESAELGTQRDQARAAYAGSRSGIAGATAQRRRAEADVDQSAAVVERARADGRQAAAGIEQARADLASAEAQLPKLQAMIRAAEATVDEASEDQRRTQSEIMRWQQEGKAAQATVKAVQSTVGKAQADARLQESTYQRLKAVQDKDAGLIAAQQVDEARARMETSRAEVEAAQGKLEAARQQASVVEPQIETARRSAAAAAKRVEAAKSRVEVAKSDLQIAQRQIEAAKQQVNVARAKHDAAVQQVAVAQSLRQAASEQTRVVDSQVISARLQSDEKRSALATASAMADYRKIIAPFDGVVTERLADPGQLVQNAATSQSGARGIVKVVRDSSLRVLIPIPESETAFIRKGRVAELVTDAYPKQPFHGTVTRFASAIDAKSRTMLTEIQVPNADRRLRAGMYVRVKLTLEVHRGALTLPSEAVMGKDDRSVWLVVDGKAKKTPVTVGVDDGKIAEITTGLQPGDVVVVTGRDSVVEGAAVKTEPAQLGSK